MFFGRICAPRRTSTCQWRFNNVGIQIVGDCRQLKMDVDSYNDNRLPVQPIQMIFDFTYDLEELALAA